MQRGNYIKKIDELFIFKDLGNGEVEKTVFESNVYKLSDNTSYIKYNTRKSKIKTK